MLTHVFPGQGSQKRGMGQGLFDEVAQYAEVEADVDATVGYSMRELCLEDKEKRLGDTRYTQPALYVVNALHYWKALQEGAEPAFLAGHSLGEYNALMAAGVFDFLTGLRLVKRRGELMAEAKNGGMAAVVGLDVDRAKEVIAQDAFGTLDVANYNSPSQIVISGPAHEIRNVVPLLQRAGAAMVVPLQVSAAFHSRYMVQAAKAFAEVLRPVVFHPLRLAVVSNVTAQPYPAGRSTESIGVLLAKQITEPVLWMQSIKYLASRGAKEFKEIGPGNVLSRLIQQIL